MRFRVYSILLSFLVLLVFAGSLPCFGVNSEDALSAISSTEARVVTCYRAAAEAAGAGANVSDLLILLNEAGWLLSRAKLAYSQGDFDSAVAYAVECRSMLDGFVDGADGLRRNAEAAGHRDFMLNFVGSAVGAVCIVVGGFALWNLLKEKNNNIGGKVD
ncbi:MAG: hypothetical protein ACUVTB_07565 [Candidatus Bathycorpusculaceae bacterium]